MINKIQDKPYISTYSSQRSTTTNAPGYYHEKSEDSYDVSFGASGNSDFTKRFRLVTKRLFNYMSSPSELTTNIIAAIGTGIIAPSVILISPGKGDKEDKNKKKFQALRQPLSAGFALLFQLPMTKIVSMVTNYLAYEKQSKIFSDETLGSLIPDKKYLKSETPSVEYARLEKEFDAIGTNGEKSALKKELESLIIEDHNDVGLETSEEELAKRVAKRKKDFLKEKYAKKKREEFFEEKVQSILDKNIKINELDLVSESEQDLAIHRNRALYDKIEQDANLSTFDKVIRKLGMSNKKLTELKDNQKVFAKEKGLEILKKDHKELFATNEAKAEKYVKVLEENSKELFKHRKNLITIVFNLCMTVLSCLALNWAHPRVKEWLDKRHKTEDDQQNTNSVANQKDGVRV